MPSSAHPLSHRTPLSRLESLVAAAKRAGAEKAEACLGQSTSLSVTWRGGALDLLERAETQEVGLRVFVGQRQTLVSTTDPRPEALDKLVEDALARVNLVPEDPFCGPATPDQLAQNIPVLDMEDPAEVTSEDLMAAAKRMAEATEAVPGVTQCESAGASCFRSLAALVTSQGFARTWTKTFHSLGASALAGEGTGMVRDDDSATCLFASDLPPPEEVGASAGNRAVRLQGARSVPTARVPVVFDSRVASGLLGHLAGAISGAAVARGTSFLRNDLGQRIFAPGITVVDDPFRPRGLRSRAFDGEGLPVQRRAMVEDGLLTGWHLDLTSARQLNVPPTGHAARSPGGLPSPSPSNFYLCPSERSPEELIKDIKEGFFVTEVLGPGVNLVTGDYSRAARGFWIKDGAFAFPVHDMTVAGNLRDMFARLVPANDLTFRYGVDAPTVVVDALTVAGA